MPGVFSHTNYRALIEDYYRKRKKEEPSFSYQVFANKAGLKAKSYLIEVVSGKKPLSNNFIFNLARAMDLKKRETEFFEALVHFNEARSIRDRELFFERMKSISGKAPGQALPANKYEYFSRWYHPVIRELITMDGFNGDVDGLARKVRPPITTKQARDSVKLLLELGLIEKLASNRYRQAEASLTTGDDVASLAVLKFQEELFSLAREALDNVPAAHRDIATLTAGVSRGCFAAMVQELKSFRRRLAQMVEQDRDQDRVYQLVMGFFPVSDMPKKESHS